MGKASTARRGCACMHMIWRACTCVWVCVYACRVRNNRGLEELVLMRNKPPKWNDEVRVRVCGAA